MSAPRNVVFIMTDQQRFDTLGCNGNRLARTPNIDRLARTGLNFQNHFVANPVCSPSRGAIMTGKYPTENGLWDNGCTLPAHQRTIASVMGDHGFQTAHFGKMHLVPIVRRVQPHPPYGFDVFEVAEGDQQLVDDDYFRWFRQQAPNEFVKWLQDTYIKGHFTGYKSELPEALHISTWTTQRSVDWLRNRRAKERPFFLSVGYFDPHHAFNPCEPYASLYDDVDVPMPPFDEAALATKPAHYRNFVRGMRKITRDPQQMKGIIKAYWAMCAHIDHCVGAILQTLREQGLDKDTAVIFTSDHGELLGSQGMLWKGPYMLDDLLKVPLIVSVPGRPLRKGVKVEGLTSSVDFLATIQAMAGVAEVVRESGRPFLDAKLRPLPEGGREFVLAEWEHHKPAPTDSIRCVRTAEHKLVHYNHSDEAELYDLRRDPQEMHNRASDPAYAKVRAELTGLLQKHYFARRPSVPHEGGW